MKKQLGFTLFEILIGLVLSSVILLAAFQFIKNTLHFVKASSELIALEREALLFFEQIYKDLSTMIPPKASEKKEEKKNEAVQKKVATSEKDDESDDKKFKWFSATIEEDELPSGKRLRLLKKLMFVTTNSLHTKSEEQPRYVRVCYELATKNKTISETSDYTIKRHETASIKTTNFKKSAEKQPESELIQTFDIARNIKECSALFYTLVDDEKKDKKTTLKEQKEWNEEKKLPHFIQITLEIWNASKTTTHKFSKLIPIFAPQELDLEVKKDGPPLEKPQETPPAAPEQPQPIEMNTTPTAAPQDPGADV